jgi:hypothetical protein
VLVHSAMRTLGYVEGGANTVVAALLEVLGTRGTLVAPTFTLRTKLKKTLSLISSATLRKPVEVGHLMRDHVHMLVAVTGPTREVYLTCSLVVGLKEGAWAH